MQKHLSYLHEAARIAQKHTIRKQNKQEKAYNTKLKTTCLNIGDRVLLANKGERRKRKLADKWATTAYTVKDRNLKTNTYMLEDSDGNTKEVHCNLVLDISFLPMVTTEEELCDAKVEEGLCAIGSLDSLEEEDVRHRTSTWVMGESENTQSQEILSEGLLELDQSIQGTPVLDYEVQSVANKTLCSPSDQSHSDRDRNMHSLVVEFDLSSSHMSDVLSKHPNTKLHPADGDTEMQLPIVDPDLDSGTQGYPTADREHVVRT